MRLKMDINAIKRLNEEIRIREKRIYKNLIERESIFMVKVAWMKYYQEQEKDYPLGDFEYIKKLDNDALIPDISENQNFIVFGTRGILSKSYCFGWYQFKETKQGSGIYRKPRLERIEGNEKNKNCESLDDVLVIFCATNPESAKNMTNIIGWYVNAEVYREIQYNEYYDVEYNICAESKYCVLLPEDERKGNKIWSLPQIQGNGINFGQSTFIYPKKFNPELQKVLQKMANYDGENWCGNFS